MNWLTQPLERVFLRPLRSLGGLSFDVVVSEEHEDTLKQMVFAAKSHVRAM